MAGSRRGAQRRSKKRSARQRAAEAAEAERAAAAAATAAAAAEAAAGEEAASASAAPLVVAPWVALPAAFLDALLLRLSPSARARACCVSRAWRDAGARPGLWAALECAAPWPWSDDALCSAAARARGGLASLSLERSFRVTEAALLRVLRANPALRTLALPHPYLDRQLAERLEEDDTGDRICDRNASTVHVRDVRAVLACAPQLERLDVPRATATALGAAQLLGGAPPFAPVCVAKLYVHEHGEYARARTWRFPAVASLRAFAAAVRGAAWLQDLTLSGALLRAGDEDEEWNGAGSGDDDAYEARVAHWGHAFGMAELVDALAAAPRLERLYVEEAGFCLSLLPEAAPHLARLLRDSAALRCFELYGDGVPLLDRRGGAAVAAALRANAALTKLRLCGVGLWLCAEAALALLDALVGHPSLRQLHLRAEHTEPQHRSAAGAALARLLAADAPALELLDVAHWTLGEAALLPVAAALGRNSHLRELDIENNGDEGARDWSPAFLEGALLPAVRGCASLRKLRACAAWPAEEHYERNAAELEVLFRSPPPPPERLPTQEELQSQSRG
jgi:hypothetical protein